MISFNNKKVIVFDLDGTIVDLAVDWQKLKSLLSNRYLEIYGDTCEFTHISACLNYIVEKQDENELKNFFKIIEDYEIKNIKNSGVITETVFFLNNLNLFGVPEDIRLAVFSLNTRKTIKKALKMADIYYKFDIIVGREDLRKWKPDPEGLLKIKDFFKVEGKEMIYFGDLEKDIITGKNAGIDSYYIDEIKTIVNKKKQKM